MYLHGGTLGSRWAEGLGVGAAVTARGGRREAMPDWRAGPARRLGDETALPTIAALPEGWTAPHPLTALLEVRVAGDRAYLDDPTVPAQARVTWRTPTLESGEAIRAVLGTLDTPPAAVWGALEVTSAKRLREHLGAAHPDADVRFTVYWRVDEER